MWRPWQGCREAGVNYITDSAAERLACWRDETCPQCGGIANRAIGLLPELLDALDTALAWVSNHGTDAKQDEPRFTANDGLRTIGK